MQADDCPRDEICVFDGVYDKVLVHKCAKRFAPGTLGCLVLFLHCELEPNVDKCVLVENVDKWRGDIFGYVI